MAGLAVWCVTFVVSQTPVLGRIGDELIVVPHPLGPFDVVSNEPPCPSELFNVCDLHPASGDGVLVVAEPLGDF